MSKAEILETLAKLTPQEREEVRQKLEELDGISAIEWLEGCELTDAEKRLLEQRLSDIEKNPRAGSSWEKVEARLRAKLSR
jgi:putative addiction module component (TIGR02574 family)